LNRHLCARFEINSDFYKTCSISLSGDDFNHSVINRRRINTYTHDAMYPPCETYLVKQIVQLKSSKEVSGKQWFNEIGRLASELIETAVPYLWKKCFYIPSL